MPGAHGHGHRELDSSSAMRRAGKPGPERACPHTQSFRSWSQLCGQCLGQRPAHRGCPTRLLRSSKHTHTPLLLTLETGQKSIYSQSSVLPKVPLPRAAERRPWGHQEMGRSAADGGEGWGGRPQGHLPTAPTVAALVSYQHCPSRATAEHLTLEVREELWA